MAFRLETLGGLRLMAADGRAIQAQRRRLALLALLAAAGERGVTRDRLVGELWPETSDERAKHALNQLLYGIRQTVSDGALLGVDPIALDPAVVDSDVRRFEAAQAAGDLSEAVAQYRGPFLDGFYLPEAPAFERRVEEVRARLAAAHVAALERLATDAEHRGDAAEAVARRRMLAELDRLDARRAMALMRALRAAGDSAGALAHGRTYETLVRQELDASVDPAVVALSNEIRATIASRAETMTAASASDPPGHPPHRTGAEVDRTGGADAVIDPPAGGAASRRTRLALAFGAAALTLVAVTFGVRQATNQRSASAASPVPSIAVLPLKNLGTNPGDAAVADGMTDALIATLSRAGDLRVVPSTWVFALRDRRIDVRQIAETLHVAYVLDGGVQQEGRRLRMRLRLIDSRDGSTRWAQTYDREMGSIFELQDDISRSVSRELGVRLGNQPRTGARARRYTPRLDAYEWYLRGMDLSLPRTAAGRSQAVQYFERAIAADSSYAAAYAGLSKMYLYEAGDAPGKHRAAFARGAWAAQRAVALDDSSAEAWAALGWTRENASDWSGAESALKRAIALDPKAPRAHEGLARIYLWTGRRAEQLTEAQLALEVDPFSYSAVRELALALSMNGRCDEALKRLLPLKSLTPPARVAGVIRGQCFAAKRMWPEAIAEFRWAMEGDARTALALLGHALARSGNEPEARRILADLLAGRKYSHGAFGIASVYAGLGDLDQAFAWLHKAAEERTIRVYIMGPMFEDLQRDPRFADVKRQLGI